MKTIRLADRRTPQKHPIAMATGVNVSESRCASSPNAVDMARVSGDVNLFGMADVVADTVE